MNFPKSEWNENIKCDLLEFLKVANSCKVEKYCNSKEYNHFKEYFPLSQELKNDLEKYTEQENPCIDITQSDDEDNPNLNLFSNNYVVTKENVSEALNSFLSISSNDPNKTFLNELLETIRDSLNVEKSVSETLLEQLLSLNAANLQISFNYFDKEFSLEDTHNFWHSVKIMDTCDDSFIEYYINTLFLARVKQEFYYDSQEIFLELSQKYCDILRNALVKEMSQINNEDSCHILMRYVSTLSDDEKTCILRKFVYGLEKLHSQHIPIIEVLLNSQADPGFLAKLIESMASVALDFTVDNAYGKLLFRAVNLLDRNVIELEQPLKRILGTHRSIWKIKIEKVVVAWFNDTLTQSFI